ncbi:hypothetical protein D3C76_1132000 [compost metagenome]
MKIPQPVLSPKDSNPCIKINFQINPTITKLRIYGMKNAALNQAVVFSFMSSTRASRIAITLTRTIYRIAYLIVNHAAFVKFVSPMKICLKLSSPINFGCLEIPFHLVRE